MTRVVRRVLPHEYSKYRAHLKGLDSESKTLRFGCAIKDEMIDTLCDGIERDQDHHVLFCIENRRLEFVAIGHIALGHKMELAFSVLPRYQGQGMGSLLMKRCIQWCRTHNILEGQMICLSHNSTIKHLCTKHKIHMVNDHGETLADIHLDPANAGTYFYEVIDRNAAVIDWLTKRTLLPLGRAPSQ